VNLFFFFFVNCFKKRKFLLIAIKKAIELMKNRIELKFFEFMLIETNILNLM
jgi:hypothetical protein